MSLKDDNLEIYKSIIDQCPNIKLKRQNMLYTSDNGYMFSLINKAGEFGFRFSEKRKKELLESLNTSGLQSHGATMRGYVKIPENLYNDIPILSEYLKESHAYIMSLEPK